MAKKSFKAFSLLEVVVMLGIFIAMILILFPIAINQLQGNKIDLEVRSLKSAMSNQAEYAFANKDNKNYGVAFFNDHYIVYSGNTLATADTTDRYDFSEDINISEINFNNLGSEINFAKGTFRPNTTGSFHINSDGSGYQININSEGLITYTKL